MGKASPAIAAFNAGEFSPQMEGRVDQEKYQIAAHVEQNFIPLKQGPAMFRPGTVFVQPVKNSANRTWLVRFEFSQTQAYVIEFGDLYCRFFTNHGNLLYTTSNYNAGTQYNPGDLVLNPFPIGNAYLCTAATLGNAPPNAAFWYPIPSATYEIPSPYAGADLTDALGEFALQVWQSGDVLYLAGGSAGAGYPPYTLTRYANAPPKWLFAQYAPTDGPFADAVPLVANASVALTVSAVQGIGITIKAWGGGIFASTDVGRLIRIESATFNSTPWANGVAVVAGAIVVNNGNNYQAMNSATTGPSPPVHTQGAVLDGAAGVLWLYTDSGYGIAKITAFVNIQQVTATVLTRFPANLVSAGAIAITGITNANPAVVTVANGYKAGDPVFLIGVSGMTQVNNTPYVNSVANAGNVTLGGVDSTTFGVFGGAGNIIQNASVEWQLGAWSATTGYPNVVAIFKDRLFWGGKLKLWGSVPGLYGSHAQDFFGLVTTDAAINITVSGSDASPICWLLPAILLLVGTEGGEYGLDAANYSISPLGPANVECLRQSGWRCRHIKPELVGTSVLYWQRAGRKLFAMDYNFYLNRYDSSDQSKLSYHISISGVTGMAYQQEPFSLLWATRADGTLLSYTYNREEQVTAWARHNMGGNGAVESIVTIPAPDGLRDELWQIVNRTINGVTARYIEYMAKHFEGPQGGNPGDAQSSAWYVDCGGTRSSPPAPGATTTTVSGLTYLQGMTVAIFADGGRQAQQVVPPSGVIVIPGAFTIVTVGLPYQGNVVPMRFEGGADVGTAQGKMKQGSQVVVRIVDGQGGVVGQLSTTTYNGGTTQIALGASEPIRYNDPAVGLDIPPPIQSGDYPVSFPNNPVTDQDARDFYVCVQQNDPFPMTVVGLFPSYKVEESQ